jgi:hypothetical protein
LIESKRGINLELKLKEVLEEIGKRRFKMMMKMIWRVRKVRKVIKAIKVIKKRKKLRIVKTKKR